MKLFDGHGDIWTDITVRRLQYHETDAFRNRHLEKFLEGGVFGGIFVIWVDPPFDSTDPKGRSDAMVTCIREELEDAKDILYLVRRLSDFEAAKQQDKLAVVNGMEGLSQIGTDLDEIDYFYHEVGVRDIMLTWNDENALATSWVSNPERGLTDLGKAAVRHIQDLGICVDVSHLNDKSFWDVMRAANRPVIASHSNARALCSLKRNLTDEMMREIAISGGVIGMNSIRQLVADEPEKQTIDQLFHHFEYVVEQVGIDHVGLGFDFDDYVEGETLESFIFNPEETPSCLGIENEAKAGNFLRMMEEKGYSEEDRRKVAYGNFFRVFDEVWK